MDGWGNNPASVEAVATALAVVAIILAWLSLRESKAQRRALEAEIGARMRPWVGLFKFGFEFAESGEPTLLVLLRNFGPIPAQRARLTLAIEPREAHSDERPDPIVVQESDYKALMPTEEGNYLIDLAPYVQMKTWIDAARDVVVRGTFEYALGRERFESQFLATLWFSRSRATDAAIPINWRNSSAS